MGSVRVVEYSSVGDSSTSIEYEFSDAQDFFEYQNQQRQVISNIFSVDLGDEDVAEKIKESFQATVKKKPKGDLH